MAKQGAGGLPACASRKYKYYQAGGHHSPTPHRSTEHDHIPSGHGGVYDSVYVTNVKSGDYSSKRQEHMNRIMGPGDPQYRFSKKAHQKNPLYKINPNVPSPHSSSHHNSHQRNSAHQRGRSHHRSTSSNRKQEKRGRERSMRRTNSEPNTKVLYRHNDDHKEGFWQRLKRSQSDPDISRTQPILRKKQSALKPNDDYMDKTAADNLRNSKIRFDNFFSRVTFIMEDPYTTILCVEETLPLEFSDESEESTSSEVTSFSASQENSEQRKQENLPSTVIPSENVAPQAACSCVIS